MASIRFRRINYTLAHKIKRPFAMHRGRKKKMADKLNNLTWTEAGSRFKFNQAFYDVLSKLPLTGGDLWMRPLIFMLRSAENWPHPIDCWRFLGGPASNGITFKYGRLGSIIFSQSINLDDGVVYSAWVLETDNHQFCSNGRSKNIKIRRAKLAQICNN